MRCRRPPFLPMLAVFAFTPVAFSQGGPPPPPPGPVPPPPVPLGNPITPAKVNLGKVLFWDEQLSSSRTVACGTCHIPTKGGSDPRSFVDSPISTHPGFDDLFGTPDDVTGSIGLVRSTASGAFTPDAAFGVERQVTGRKAPSMIMAAYSPRLFWDGRADPVFEDPITGNITLNNLAALESQAVGPFVSDVEMAHVGRDFQDVLDRLAEVDPLALSPQIPAALETWINDRSYPQLFAEAFGTPTITGSRVAMAIATYERTLIANQSPFDAFLAGTPGALTPQQNAGRNVFLGPGNCVPCHGGNLQTDNLFHNNGVRPIFEDLGRGAITGNPADNGRFRTPTLRNVALRGPYFHNGGFQTLAEVVEFYDRGGDFFVNQDILVQPLGLSQQQKNDLVAFLGGPVFRERIGAATFRTRIAGQRWIRAAFRRL
jgi:cytochrome c peroxidase